MDTKKQQTVIQKQKKKKKIKQAKSAKFMH